VKALSTILAIAFAAALLPAQTQGKFDPFRNVTHFSTRMTGTGGVKLDGHRTFFLFREMLMGLTFDCPGPAIGCIPPAVNLAFTARTTEWTMQGSHPVDLLIDGAPEHLGNAAWDGHVFAGDDLEEYNDVLISPAVLRKMAAAKSIEVQIGVVEFSLSKANMSSIRDAAAHMTAPTN
jgi:hypothetical protein